MSCHQNVGTNEIRIAKEALKSMTEFSYMGTVIIIIFMIVLRAD